MMLSGTVQRIYNSQQTKIERLKIASTKTLILTVGLYRDMTYFYPLPHKAYKFISSPIDTAPLAERYQLLMVFISVMLTAGRPQAVLAISRRVAHS